MPDSTRGPFSTKGPLLVASREESTSSRNTRCAVFAAVTGSETDATLVRRLRAAGAIVLAKTNMHEWAYGIETPDQFAALRDAFRRSKYWQVIIERGGSYLFRLKAEQFVAEDPR